MDEEALKSYLNNQLLLLSKKVKYINDTSWNGNIDIPTFVVELTGSLRGTLSVADTTIEGIKGFLAIPPTE